MTPKRIIVAEDDPEMMRLVAGALRRDGHEVVEVADGGRLLVKVASEYIREERETIDLIVSDIRMPVCSGLEILKGLRDARWPIPVILMTAFGDDDTRARAHDLGAWLIDKPFELAELRATVNRLVANHSPRPSRASQR